MPENFENNEEAKKKDDFFDETYDIPSTPNETGKDDWESEEERWKKFDERNKERALELLGLDRIYNMLSEKEKSIFLESAERIRAFDNIDTSTNPRKQKIKQKKGIVSEILKSNLIPENILKNYPLVYLGSGTDIEYPLALGARKIIMVDCIFKQREAVADIFKKIKQLTGKDPILESNGFSFEFNFGNGGEAIKIEISSNAFNPQDKEMEAEFGKFVPPQKIGMILFFASHGPRGSIILDNETQSRVVEQGIILSEDFFQKKIGKDNNWENLQLGHKKE